MEVNAEHMDRELKKLKEINEMLNLEKECLENENRVLQKNEAVFVDRLNNVVIQLEKKQETITKLETLGQKLRSEIQPLQCIKDNLEKKLSTYIDCNQTQLERIECLKMINEELKNERGRFLEIYQNNLDEIKSLQREVGALKNELFNFEKFKSEVEELKNKNVVLLKDIDNLKLDEERLKSKLEKNLDFRRDELISYKNMLAKEREKNSHIDIELSKTVKKLQLQVSEQQKQTCSEEENKKCKYLMIFVLYTTCSCKYNIFYYNCITAEMKRKISDFDTKNTTSDSVR